MPAPSTAGQVTTQPSLLARVVAALGLGGSERVLEVGTGLGRVMVVVGDGTLGLPEYGPYQAIVVAAAAPRVPAPLIEQLAPGDGWCIRSVRAATSR